MSASAPLDPAPYLAWTLPYNSDNIAFSLGRLDLSDRVRVLDCNAPRGSLSVDKRLVAIVEAPQGTWGVWVCSESTLQCALCSGEYSGVREAQIRRIHEVMTISPSQKMKDLKVPACEPVHSGPASVCNARWLAPARRRGHPTGSAYMEVRDLDTKAWHALEPANS